MPRTLTTRKLAHFAVVAVESTGTDPRTDRVLSVGVVLADRTGTAIETWQTLVNPGPGIDTGARHIHGIGPEDLTEAIRTGEVERLLHRFEPQPGDSILIEAGTVHAIGAGVLLAEIQQMSDTTFRLFDWNRVGPDGQPRPLHIREAMESIDFDRGPAPFAHRGGKHTGDRAAVVFAQRKGLVAV